MTLTANNAIHWENLLQRLLLKNVYPLNWREPHQISPNCLRLVLRQTNKRCRREKVTTPCSQNVACLVRLYSGGQWTIAEAKLASSLCIGMNRRCPFPLCYFIPSYYTLISVVRPSVNETNAGLADFLWHLCMFKRAPTFQVFDDDFSVFL